MEYIGSIIWWIVVMGTIIYFVFIKKNQNRKAAETGEDRERIKKAVGEMLVGVDDYKLVFRPLVRFCV